MRVLFSNDDAMRVLFFADVDAMFLSRD